MAADAFSEPRQAWVTTARRPETAHPGNDLAGYILATVGATVGAGVLGIAGGFLGNVYGEAAGADVWELLGTVLMAAALGAWIGSVLGCWALLRLGRRPAAVRTAVVHSAVLPVLMVGGAMFPVGFGILPLALAAPALSRLIAAATLR